MLKHPAIEKLLEPATSEKVLSLPAHLFFIERISIPPELDLSELDDFAELTIESISPFPLDQLYWGFLSAESCSSILLYAAHRERVKEVVSEPIEAYAWVVPEFAPLASTHFPETTEIIVASDSGSSLLHFAKGNGVPTHASSIACLPEEREEAIGRLRTEAPALSPEVPQILLEPTSAVLGENQQPVFHFQATLSGDASTDESRLTKLSPTGTLLWRADVRDARFKKSEQSARRVSLYSLRTLSWAAIAALLLLIGELALLGTHLWLGAQQARIAEQQPLVATISEQQTLMFKLEQIERNDLRPIAILDALNNLRPNGIYFTKTVVEGENTVIIDGVSNNVNALNSYTDALQNSGSFELLEDPKTITRQGKTTFTLQLAYSLPQKEASAVNRGAGQPAQSDA